eukprot:277423_1
MATLSTKHHLLIHGFCRELSSTINMDITSIIEKFSKPILTVWSCNDDNEENTIQKINIDSNLTLSRYFMNGNCTMMFITNDNSLYCIGANNQGAFGMDMIKIGSGTIKNPIKHNYFSKQKIKTISEGVYGNHNFIVCIDDDQYFYAFGGNEHGELAINEITDNDPYCKSIPTKIKMKESIECIKCGARFSLLLSSYPNSNIYSSGENTYGQLGLGDTINRKQFILIEKLVSVHCKVIECGINQSYVIDNKYNIWVFGTAANGRLGLGNNDNIIKHHILSPMKNKYFIENNIKIVEISCGDRHVCCLSYSNKVYTFGWNIHGQCGNSTDCDVVLPYQVMFANNGKQCRTKTIGCGSRHTVILDDDSNLFIFG